VVERDSSLVPELPDLLGHEVRLVELILGGVEEEPFAFGSDGDQLLGLAELIVLDDRGGRAQNARRRAIVCFQLNDLTVGEVVLELKDIRWISAAPAKDRLIVVADDTNILVLFCEQPREDILRIIGVLILVYHEKAKAIAIEVQDI
jgi:hypothetical protein